MPKPQAVTRDQVGKYSPLGDPLLEGRVEVTLKDGTRTRAGRYSISSRSMPKHFDPKTTEKLTWAPAAAIESLAREIAKVPGTTLFAIGMGPNQFFNNDNKDRTQFLLAALTGNIGKLTGNIGSYAGNYRVAMFNGVPQYINENPFDLELDGAKPARPKQFGSPSRRTTTTTKMTCSRWAKPRSPARAICQRRPNRCGSPTPTQFWETSSGTTTRWSTCCPRWR